MMDFSFFGFFASVGTLGLARPLCNVFHIIYRDVTDFF